MARPTIIAAMNAQRGFSIIELMTAVAIVAILVTVGLPSLRELMANNRLTSQINAFASSLSLARSEAVKVNRTVVVCPSSDGATCATGVDWNVGWIVYVDDGSVVPIQSVAALTPASNTLKTDLGADTLSYNGLGATNQSGLFVLCDNRGDSHAKGLVVAPTGRVSVRTTNLDGSALTCTP